MPRDDSGPRRSLRAQVIQLYERRLPKGRLAANAGVWSLHHMRRQLDRLTTGNTVQLHRFGELARCRWRTGPPSAHGRCTSYAATSWSACRHGNQDTRDRRSGPCDVATRWPHFGRKRRHPR
jgi:hypothetical protein